MSRRFSVVIGNPPYGKNSQLAPKFLEKSLDISDRVDMILPRVMMKDSFKSKINPYSHCVLEEVVSDDTFPRNIKTVRQVWEIKDTKRDEIVFHKTHPDFEFKKRTDMDTNVFVMRAGCAGIAKTTEYDSYRSSSTGHFFIKAKSQEVIDRLVKCQDEFIEISSNVNGGRRVLNKHELISIYNSHIN